MTLARFKVLTSWRKLKNLLLKLFRQDPSHKHHDHLLNPIIAYRFLPSLFLPTMHLNHDNEQQETIGHGWEVPMTAV